MLVLCAVVAVPVLAWAQVPTAVASPPMPRLEFDAAIKQALDRNPNVAQAMVAIARADALLQQARAFTLPSVSMGFANTTLDSPRGFSGGVTQPQNQFAFSANVRYEAGRNVTARHAEDQVEIATLSSAETRERVRVAAAQAYLAVIAGRRQVEVIERSFETSSAHLDYANKRLEGGAGSRVNQLRAAQVVTADQWRLENARLNLRRAQEALGVIVVADGPVDAGAEPVFDTSGALAENAALMARPDLQTQAAVQRAAEQIVKDHWLRWVPLPVLSFDPSLVTPQGLFQPAKTYRFSVQMVQPIFDGGERRAERRARQTEVDQSKLTFFEIETRARSEVRMAQVALASLKTSLAITQTAASQSEEVLRITTAAFELGATTNIEVIDAQRSLRVAESEAAVAEDAVRRAELDLLVALGRF